MNVIIKLIAAIIGFSLTSYCQEFDQELMKKSSVIFFGTVTKLNATSFAEVPVSENNAVVKVDVLLEKPGAVSIANGQEVTVQLRDPSAFRVGTKATFYADGWIVGKGIALVEVGHAFVQEPDSISIRAKSTKSYIEAKRQLAEARLKAQIDSAEVVALAKVTRIQSPVKPESGQKWITEHDPEWQEAILKVEAGIKGVTDGDEIVVRFPGTMDVMYFGIPKFREGESQIVLLGKDSVSGLPKAMVAGKQVETYIVEKPADVIAKENIEQIRRIAKEL